MKNYYIVLSMTRVNDTKLRNIAKTICSLYDGNLQSLNARNMNLPSCFSTTGSVEQIISLNTIESGLPLRLAGGVSDLGVWWF